MNNYNAMVRTKVGEELKRQNRMRAFHWLMSKTRHISNTCHGSAAATAPSPSFSILTMFALALVYISIWSACKSGFRTFGFMPGWVLIVCSISNSILLRNIIRLLTLSMYLNQIKNNNLCLINWTNVKIFQVVVWLIRWNPKISSASRKS